MIFTLYKFIKIYVNLYTTPQKSGRHKSRPQKNHILNQLCKRNVEGAAPYILPRLLNTKKFIRYVRQALLHALTSEALNQRGYEENYANQAFEIEEIENGFLVVATPFVVYNRAMMLGSAIVKK